MIDLETQRKPPVWIAIAVLLLALGLFAKSILDRDEEPAQESDPVLETTPSSQKYVFAEGDLEEETEKILEEVLTPLGFESPDFLATDYEPLAKWLDERFEVDYKNMKLALIFDQVPLNDVFYEVGDMEGKTEAFHFRSEDTTRRNLLREIAKHWDLDMDFVLDEQGMPTAISVTAP